MIFYSCLGILRQFRHAKAVKNLLLSPAFPSASVKIMGGKLEAPRSGWNGESVVELDA